MDKLEKYLRLLERDYIKEDIESLNPKDRLNFYLLMKEFEVPKLQRVGYQAGADNVDEITVTYIDRKELKRREDEAGN